MLNWLFRTLVCQFLSPPRPIQIFGQVEFPSGLVIPFSNLSGKSPMVTVPMTDSEYSVVTFKLLDKRAQALSGTGGVTPVWSVDNPAVVSLAPNADGSVQVNGVSPGQAVLSVVLTDSTGKTIPVDGLEFNVSVGAPASATLSFTPPVESAQ